MKSGGSFRSSLAKLKGHFFACLREESSFGLEPVLQGEAVTEKPRTANGRKEASGNALSASEIKC